jgi:short-subunit dehydrogenase
VTLLRARPSATSFRGPGGGAILNNSSVLEIIPKPKYLLYSTSKGGMET